MERVRPTLRCLRNDLHIPLPPVSEPLGEIDHPLLAKANEQFTHDETPHERIRVVDDEILFKVKVQRWRGAVWLEQVQPWLVAAGKRESGSAEDFYTTLGTEGRAARARHNAAGSPQLRTDTYVEHLLPGADDEKRYRLEAGVRLVRHIESLVPALVADSLRDGREHIAELDTFRVGVQVRAADGHETYVAIRITGSVSFDLTRVILDTVPGCDRAGWYPESTLPERRLDANEQAWSNIMDPIAAAKLLDLDDL